MRRTGKSPHEVHMSAFDPADVEHGREVLAAELRAIEDMIPKLDERYARAVAMLVGCRGRVVVTGVGKSGLIGQKISATMASTGTASLFLHSGEAVHGDMGRVLADDVVLALSYSGTTAEVVRLVPIIRKIGASLVTITSAADSELARHADVALEVGVIEEACPIGLAPTSSTTAMLALGDALAMTVANRKEFTRADYALFHRGGALGRRLVTVGEVMRPLSEVAPVRDDVSVRDAFAATGGPRSRSGALLVVSEDGSLAGIFTDGDLRRRIVDDAGVLLRPVREVMTANPKVTRQDELLATAYKRLRQHSIDELPVVDAEGRPVGLLDVQDVLEFGVAL